MRLIRLTLAVLAFALMPAPAPAQAPPDPLASIASTQAVPDPLEPSIAADVLRGHVPVPADGPALPAEPFAIALAVAAAKRGRKRGDVPMILDSHVDVMRENKKGDPEPKRFAPGQLLEDTDLTDEEVDDLTKRKAIRPASQEELQQLEKGSVEQERANMIREQEEELAKVRAEHEQQRAELGDDASPKKRAALEERQAGEITKLQAAHAKALAKLDEE